MDWTISMGFATGNPPLAPGNTNHASWFSVQRTWRYCILSDAIARTREAGYKLSDDICADWVFWCKDSDGHLVDLGRQANAEVKFMGINPEPEV
jgi:hypothetical protein